MERFAIQHYLETGHATVEMPTQKPRQTYIPLSTAGSWYDYFVDISDKDMVAGLLTAELEPLSSNFEMACAMRAATERSSIMLTIIAALEAAFPEELGTMTTLNLHLVGADSKELKALVSLWGYYPNLFEQLIFFLEDSFLCWKPCTERMLKYPADVVRRDTAPSTLPEEPKLFIHRPRTSQANWLRGKAHARLLRGLYQSWTNSFYLHVYAMITDHFNRTIVKLTVIAGLKVHITILSGARSTSSQIWQLLCRVGMRTKQWRNGHPQSSTILFLSPRSRAQRSLILCEHLTLTQLCQIFRRQSYSRYSLYMLQRSGVEAGDVYSERSGSKVLGNGRSE